MRNSKPGQSKGNVGFFQPLGCGLQDWEARLLLQVTMAEEHQMMGAKHCAGKGDSEDTVHNLLICLGRGIFSAAGPSYRLWLGDSIF